MNTLRFILRALLAIASMVSISLWVYLEIHYKRWETVTVELVETIARSRDLENASCRLVDKYYTDDLYMIEAYACKTWKRPNPHTDQVHLFIFGNNRLLVIDELPIGFRRVLIRSVEI